MASIHDTEASAFELNRAIADVQKKVFVLYKAHHREHRVAAFADYHEALVYFRESLNGWLMDLMVQSSEIMGEP